MMLVLFLRYIEWVDRCVLRCKLHPLCHAAQALNWPIWQREAKEELYLMRTI